MATEWFLSSIWPWVFPCFVFRAPSDDYEVTAPTWLKCWLGLRHQTYSWNMSAAYHMFAASPPTPSFCRLLHSCQSKMDSGGVYEIHLLHLVNFTVSGTWNSSSHFPAEAGKFPSPSNISGSLSECDLQCLRQPIRLCFIYWAVLYSTSLFYKTVLLGDCFTFFWEYLSSVVV